MLWRRGRVVSPLRYSAAVVATRKGAVPTKKRSKTKANASGTRSIRRVSRGSRDDFPIPVLKQLAAEVAFLCSNPKCCAPTIGPSKQRGISNVGVGAHITAAAPGGPRFNKRLTRAQRIAAGNGIWMCHRCGRLVDNDAKTYPVEMLRRWKREAIRRAHSDLQSGGRNSRLRSEADVVAAVRAGNRAERESQVALEAVTASHHVLDVLANASGTVGKAQRDLRAGRHELRDLSASVDEVASAWQEMDRVARAVEALWDGNEARRCWRLANFTHGQLNGMRNLLSKVEVASRGQAWDGPTYASEILDETYMGQINFVCEVEMLVAEIDSWADKPLHRKRTKGIRYEWPG
jgi:hypothetical protein